MLQIIPSHETGMTFSSDTLVGELTNLSQLLHDESAASMTYVPLLPCLSTWAGENIALLQNWRVIINLNPNPQVENTVLPSYS